MQTPNLNQTTRMEVFSTNVAPLRVLHIVPPFPTDFPMQSCTSIVLSSTSIFYSFYSNPTYYSSMLLVFKLFNIKYPQHQKIVLKAVRQSFDTNKTQAINNYLLYNNTATVFTANNCNVNPTNLRNNPLCITRTGYNYFYIQPELFEWVGCPRWELIKAKKFLSIVLLRYYGPSGIVVQALGSTLRQTRSLHFATNYARFKANLDHYISTENEINMYVNQIDAV